MRTDRILNASFLSLLSLRLPSQLSLSLERVRRAGAPIELIQPETLKIKAIEPILLLGRQRFANLDLRIRVKGGGHVSQMYGECLYYAAA